MKKLLMASALVFALVIPAHSAEITQANLSTAPSATSYTPKPKSGDMAWFCTTPLGWCNYFGPGYIGMPCVCCAVGPVCTPGITTADNLIDKFKKLGKVKGAGAI